MMNDEANDIKIGVIMVLSTGISLVAARTVRVGTSFIRSTYHFGIWNPTMADYILCPIFHARMHAT